MSTCRACGGVLGRDCFNEQDCLMILHSQQQQAFNPQEIEIRDQHITVLERRVTELEKALREISQLDPSDTKNGFNEWGEAECFNKAQDLAKRAMEGK
jgi:hypothetical protein